MSDLGRDSYGESARKDRAADQPAPDFEEARDIVEDVLTNPKWAHEVCERGSCLAPTTHYLARTVKFLLSEREAREEWEKDVAEFLRRLSGPMGCHDCSGGTAAGRLLALSAEFEAGILDDIARGDFR